MCDDLRSRSYICYRGGEPWHVRQALHSLLPRLVYAHFTAFGREGPKVNEAGLGASKGA